MAITVDVISDVVCPWCYIGHKKLHTALEQFEREHPELGQPVVRWHPFQLNPNLPSQGIDRAQYLSEKFGDRAPQVYDRVSAVGREVGIEFAFNAIQRQPNTRKAHSLIAACAAPELQDAMVQALFVAYFIDAEDLTQDDVLRRVALRVGLEEQAIESALNGANALERIESADQRARDMGVQGVPFFVFNERVALSGAQSPETIVKAMVQSTA